MRFLWAKQSLEVSARLSEVRGQGQASDSFQPSVIGAIRHLLQLSVQRSQTSSCFTIAYAEKAQRAVQRSRDSSLSERHLVTLAQTDLCSERGGSLLNRRSFIIHRSCSDVFSPPSPHLTSHLPSRTRAIWVQASLPSSDRGTP
jgi:hypothetical protein